MTTHCLRVRVLFGALSAVALSLILVADTATAQASAQRSQARRRRPIPQEELDRIAPLWPAHSRAGMALRGGTALRLPQPTPTAVQKPAAAVQADGALANREPGISYPIVRGAHRIGILPKYLPPFPGPASPIR